MYIRYECIFIWEMNLERQKMEALMYVGVEAQLGKKREYLVIVGKYLKNPLFDNNWVWDAKTRSTNIANIPLPSQEYKVANCSAAFWFAAASPRQDSV